MARTMAQVGALVCVAAMLLAAAAPVANAVFCSSTGVFGFYYQNTDVTVPGVMRQESFPVIVRADFNITGVVNGNNYTVFAAQFSTNWFGNFIPPATGVYYFRYTSDDGIRLFFQNIRQPEVSNQWGTHTATAYNSNPYSMIANKPYSFNPVYFNNVTTIQHQLTINLVTNSTGGTGRQFGTLNSGSFSSCLSIGAGMVRPVGSQPSFGAYCPSSTNGLTANYYSDTAFTTFVGTGTVPNLDIVATSPPGPLSPSATSYSIVYSGLLALNQSDNYQVSITYQDKFALYLNNLLIASGTAPSGNTLATVTTTAYFPIMSTQVYPIRAELVKLNDGSTDLAFTVQLRRLTPSSVGFVTIPTTSFVNCQAPGIVAPESFDGYTSTTLSVPVSLRRQPSGTVCLQLAALDVPSNQTVEYAPTGLVCFTSANFATPQTLTVFPGLGLPQYTQIQLSVATTADATLYPVGLDHIIELTRGTSALVNGMGGGVCTAYGLSHFITFDGLFYTTATSGDFYLAKYQSGEVQVQARMGPCGSATSQACVLGVAVLWYNQRIVINLQNTRPLIWTNFNTAIGGDGGIVIRNKNGRDFTMTFPDHLIVQVFTRQYTGTAQTWALQAFVSLPSAYTATFQSVRGLCGTATSTTTDEFLDFTGSIVAQNTFVASMKIANGESLFVSALGAVSTAYGAAVPALLTTQRAVNSPQTFYPTSDGVDITTNVALLSSLYSPNNSPMPSASVSAPGAGAACSNLTIATMPVLCSNAGFPNSSFTALTAACQTDTNQLSLSQASAISYQAAVFVCTFFAMKTGTTLDPTNNQKICPTLCFLQGTCSATNACTCSGSFTLSDCSRLSTQSIYTQLMTPLSGNWNTLVRARGAFYFMDPPQTTLFCQFNTTKVAVTSVTEYDLLCNAPVGLYDAQSLSVVRSGVSTNGTFVFNFPAIPSPLYFGDQYTAGATCANVALYPPFNSYRDCVMWQPTFLDVGKIVTLGATKYCCARRGTYETGIGGDYCSRSNCLSGPTDVSTSCMAVNGQVGSACFQYCVNVSPTVGAAAANASANAVPIYNGASYPPINSNLATTLLPTVQRNIFMVLADDSLDVGWAVPINGTSTTVGCRVHGIQDGGQTNCLFGCGNYASVALSTCITAPSNGCYCFCQLKGTGVFPT